ncbi:A24 family peptidase [Novosphingobium sp. M1R2S20]|uniref:Prepilin peptidase n=1 Tax=Novosphingobium rhizovicinum TaxID=3228928 RepID=A0ABV3R7T7_9SPHN
MLSGLISYALLAALATALLIAAATDLRRREIDNWLNLAIALAAPLYWLSAGMDWVAVLFQIGLAGLTFVIACTLFALRQMGGGDVKLLSALALWFVPGSFLQVIVIMGVIGGAASIAMAVFNMQRIPGESVRNALSTLCAALWVLGACALIYPAATGRPLVNADDLLPVAEALPAGWPLLVAASAVLAIFLAGMMHIFRRQRGAIAIPYGVAISAAGLWVLARSTIPLPLTDLMRG